MKLNDTISILICVHSQDTLHDDLLHRALMSLDRQTYCDFDVHVVLNDCHEFTERVTNDFPGLRLHKHFKPVKDGLASAKNFGLSKMSSDWTMYLDADDEYMDCKVEVQRNWMLANPEYDFVFAQSWDRREDGKIVPNCFPMKKYETDAQIKAVLGQENVLAHGSACIRKSALDALGGYDTSDQFKGAEDWALWKSAVRSGYKFWNISERIYIYSLGTGVAR